MLVIAVTSVLCALLVACVAALYPHSGVLFPTRPGHSEMVAEMVLLVQLERVAEAFPPDRLLHLEAVG